MMIPTDLDKLIHSILHDTHSEAEWLDLETQANTYLGTLSIEQQDYFAESGAGELLYMICSGIRYDKKGT